MSSKKPKLSNFSSSKKEKQPLTACLLVIGNEILTGQTQDVHIQYLGEKLLGQGIDLKEVRVIGDDIQAIATQVNQVRSFYTYVFTTGGIGPTHDDKTAEAIAQAFNLPLEENEEALALLRTRWKDETLSSSNRRMARIPKGAILIENVVTQAPGFQVNNVYVLAGVPSIMRAMTMAILPTLKGGSPLKSKSISCLLGEGILAETLKDLELQYPSLQIGSYPFFLPEGHGTTLVLRGTQEEVIEKASLSLENFLRSTGGKFEKNPVHLFQDSCLSSNSFSNQHSSKSTFKFSKASFKLPKLRHFILIVGIFFFLFLYAYFTIEKKSSSEIIQKEVLLPLSKKTTF